MPDIDPKEAVTQLMTAFNEFKAANDENIKKHDVLLEDKIDKINAAMDKFEPLNQQITLAAQNQKSMQDQMDQIQMLLQTPNLGGTSTEREAKEFRAAFDRIIRRPPQDRDPKDMAIYQRVAALVKSDDVSAGYLLAPPDMQAEIIKDIVLMTPIRQLATVRTIGVGSLKGIKKTGHTTATRVGEVTTRTNTGDLTYGMYEFQAPEMFTRSEVSLQMLEDTMYDLLGELREDSSQQFSVKEGYESINGLNAANQMEGLLVNADIVAVNSGAAASIPNGDAIWNLFYELKTGYTQNAVFTLNRSTLGKIRKLKDGNGQYIWTPGIAMAVPNLLAGAPYVEFPDMPNVAAGTYPVLFGDFKRTYIMADRIAIAFQVDYITGADNGLVVFRGRRRVGGGVRQADSMKKLYIGV